MIKDNDAKLENRLIMKLSTYAKTLGLHYQTVWRHFKMGLIPGAYQLPTGTIIVPQEISQKHAQRIQTCTHIKAPE